MSERWIENDRVEERTVALRDGPMDGALTVKPSGRMRKTQHARGFRLSDEQQPWHPGDEGPERVKFAVYLWIVSDQAYCWVDYVTVGSEQELLTALAVVAG